LKVVFAGTPDFSVDALNALLASEHDVIAVYTQPDRPAGRGRKLRASPVKQRAVDAGIPVFQPTTLKDPEEQKKLADLSPDVMVVVAYGLLLPEAILEIPRYGCLNIHASLLPRWRGAAPIQRAILAGDAETGVTIMQMDKGLDTGDMILKVTCPIEADDTAQTLHDRLAQMGANAIVSVVDALDKGTLTPEKQDESQSCYAAKLDKSEAKLDWNLPAMELEWKVRAFNPWPVAQTVYGKDSMRIWRARAIDMQAPAEPGTVVQTGKEGIDVATGQGVLRLLEIQMPGKKAMSAEAFLNAHNLDGVKLG
jgi:methionyl-tRNA formyltransferase